MENENIEEILLNTQEQCQMMEQFIKKQIEVKDAMIDKLHKELEGYRQDAADRFVNQLMKEIIKLRKALRRKMMSDDWGEMSADELRREYRYVFEDLTDVLEQQNIDEYSTPEGTEFDAAIHIPVLETTNDITLDKKVKQSMNEGYKKGEKVIIPEKVLVYSYKEE